MSLRHALLGLLAHKPASGYDLTQEFAGDLGRYAWQASHTQIYPELRRLAGDNLVEVVEEGPRNRRTYAITDAGRAELRSWLITLPTQSVVRNEPVLRMFLLSALDPADARELLTSQAEGCQQDLDEIRASQQADAPAAHQESPPFGRFAAEFGARFYAMTRDWALWARDELDVSATRR